jgi:hypothetical protein
MLAYCGINCAECPAYKGTVTARVGGSNRDSRPFC